MNSLRYIYSPFSTSKHTHSCAHAFSIILCFKKWSDDLERLRTLNKQIFNSTNTFFVQAPVCIVHYHNVLTKGLTLALLRISKSFGTLIHSSIKKIHIVLLYAVHCFKIWRYITKQMCLPSAEKKHIIN